MTTIVYNPMQHEYRPITNLYILIKKTPVQEPDLMKWTMWYEKNFYKRRVASTRLPNKIHVSTVFLGINSEWRPDFPPALFETMIFGGKFDGYMNRYSTWEDAEAGHKIACQLIMNEVVIQN